MAKLEPIVFVCFPEPREKATVVYFHYKALPKWVQLYIMRWWQRKRNCQETERGVCPENDDRIEKGA